MSPELNTILKSLPHLKPEELKAVKGRVGALTSLGGGSQIVSMDLGVVEARIIHSYDWLFEGVIAELRRRGLLRRGAGLPSRVIPASFKEASVEVRRHLEEHVGTLGPQQSTALGQLAARELASYLERGSVPISSSTLLNNISKVPVALDQAYPGYLEAGLLSFCWR